MSLFSESESNKLYKFIALSEIYQTFISCNFDYYIVLTIKKTNFQ